MGQYLSQPATEKESEEGHVDALAFGLAAMQGWRVSMEDAHIAELELDPANKTALFSVFDGHGGRAVSQYCAAHLAELVLASDAYRRGDLGTALTEAYFRLDVLLDSEAGEAELQQLVADAKPKQPAALFTDVESKLAAPAQAHEERVQQQSGDEEAATTPLAGGAADAAAASSSAPDPDPAASAAELAQMKKINSSKDFYESHLMRASVLTPVEAEQERVRGAAAASHPPVRKTDTLVKPAAGEKTVAAAQDPTLSLADSLISGSVAMAAGTLTQHSAAANDGVSDEDENVHHAAGMGATAVSVLVRGNKVVVANTGDSRCVMSKRGQARALTLDHKPILFEEAKRIIKAGGFVRDNRINGALNVSRTLGDLDFKRNTDLPATEQMVVATPDIEEFSLEEGDEFLVIACDGIWDVLTNQEAVDFVRKRLKAGEGLKSICEQMCDACLAPDLKGLCRGADNMSVIVVLFKKHARLGGFWSSLLAACGRSPAYNRMASSSETRRR